MRVNNDERMIFIAIFNDANILIMGLNATWFYAYGNLVGRLYSPGFPHSIPIADHRYHMIDNKSLSSIASKAILLYFY